MVWLRGSDVNCSTRDGEGGFEHGFGEGRVGVTSPRQIFAGGTEIHGDRGLGDQISRPITNCVNAQNAVGNFIDKHSTGSRPDRT